VIDPEVSSKGSIPIIIAGIGCLALTGLGWVAVVGQGANGWTLLPSIAISPIAGLLLLRRGLTGEWWAPPVRERGPIR
jgi:hypothetical protein